MELYCRGRTRYQYIVSGSLYNHGIGYLKQTSKWYWYVLRPLASLEYAGMRGPPGASGFKFGLWLLHIWASGMRAGQFVFQLRS